MLENSADAALYYRYCGLLFMLLPLLLFLMGLMSSITHFLFLFGREKD